MTFKIKHNIPSFKKEYTNPISILNKNNPISVKYNEDLIDRVHARYPIIDRYKISLIIKTTFICIRELLVIGHILKLTGLFNVFRMYFYSHTRKKNIYPALRVKITTPPQLREK